MAEQNNTAAALLYAETHAIPDQLEIEHDGLKVPVLVIHNTNGSSVVPVKPLLDPFRKVPERRKGTITVDDLDSFIFLTNRDKDPDSVIFAGRGADQHPYLVAVLDFHDAGALAVASGAAVSPSACTPRFCEDRIRYAFPLSDEWKTWAGAHGSIKGQAEFAAFIEDHLFDIGEPGAAGNISQAFASRLGISFATQNALLTVSRGLEVRSASVIKEARNLENGDVSITFESNETGIDGAPLKVPSAFHVMIPIFKGGAIYSIPVRLRRRTKDGRLVWFVELHRADLFLDDAIKDALDRVRLAPATDPATSGGCGLPVVRGTPPAGGA